jgi:hypothetical protein
MLTREQIDTIIGSLTMGDVQEAFASDAPDKAIAGLAFARAAKRSKLVNGSDPLDQVSVADVKYLGERMQAAMSDNNPKSGTTEGSPPSADSGE